MSDMAASDITVTIGLKDRTMRRLRNEIVLAFGDASLTYPTHGIPLPAKRALGFNSHIDRIDVENTPDVYAYVYDRTYYTLRMYSKATGSEFSGAIAATTLYLTAYGA
jgi:hypothetical protein